MTAFVILSALAFVFSPCSAWWFSNDLRVEPHEDVSDECLRLAAWGRCEFYECLERRFPCGHRGYAIHVGQYFCRKTINMMDDFTSDGYQWMNRTNICLTKSFLPVYESYATRCGDIRDEGADGILECYTRVDPDGRDFCSFVRDNSEEYLEIFGMEEIRRMMRLRKPGLLTRLFIDGASCGASSLRDRFLSLTGVVNDIIGTMLEHWEDLTDRWTNFWN